METQNAFQTFFLLMGPYKWPLILLTVIVFVQCLIKFYHFFVQKKPNPKGLNDILFWGGITAIVGIVGQLSGIWVALNEMMKAQDISPQIVMIGYFSSFVSTQYGLMVLLFSALIWWGLRYKMQQL